MTKTVERKEDMSPDGAFSLHQQDDGDFVITIFEGGPNGGIEQMSSVEFTTPFIGGGGSPHTFKALGELFKAMQLDNQENLARKGRDYD